jgi:hypothetical protein
MTPEVTKIGNKLFDKVELSSVKIELGKLDDIEKAKSNSLSKIKNHFSKRNEWGAESNKILGLVGDIERKGVDLKKEADLLDKDLVNIYTEISNLKKQAETLGLELPQSIDLLDGVSISAYGNKFVDTREIVDGFKNKLK